MAGQRSFHLVSSGSLTDASPLISHEYRGSPCLRTPSLLDRTEEEHIFRIDSSNFECGSFASRCSLKLINEVVSSLDQNKRQLVHSTGFGGLLHFPPMKQINRKFALWLMSCVDESTQTLVVGDHIRIRFCKEDVGNVFGIPCSGKRVFGSRDCSRVAKEKVLDEYLGPKFKKHRSIKQLIGIIQHVYDRPMSKAEQDSFRIAFVVFVVSTVLNPSTKHDYACIDYWRAIQDPDAIADFDWSEFVIMRFLEAVCKLKQDICSSVKFPNITGCSVFIQVLYLDSVDLGDLSIVENSIPRMRHFGFDLIRSMISADNNYLNYVNGNTDATPTKLRDGGACCYYWAFESLAPVDFPRSGSLFAIWESCVAMARFLDVPLEAAGPLFVAAADFQDQVDAGLATSGVHAIKYISVLLSILSAFKDGFTYHFSIEEPEIKDGSSERPDHISRAISGGLKMLSVPVRLKRKQPDISPSNISDITSSIPQTGSSNGCQASSSCCPSRKLRHFVTGATVQSSIKAALDSLEAMRPELNVNHQLINAMSKFYSMVRRMKVPYDFDLNESSSEDVRVSNGTFASPSCFSSQPPSPSVFGSAWTIKEVNSKEVFARLSRVLDTEGFVIVHRSPRHIQVSARSFRSQLLGHSEFEIDLFDAIIRQLKQDDDDLYNHAHSSRWRHFFESDFMGTITSGSFDMSHSKLVQHFSSSYIISDLRSCRLLFFPVLLQYRWVCYSWSLVNNVIHVFDPSYPASIPETTIDCHERICFLLKSVMHSLARSVFQDWNFPWSLAELRILTGLDNSVIRYNRTGVLAAYFCRSFDGEDLSTVNSSADTDAIACKLTLDLVKLKGNIGHIPSVLS